MSGRRPAPAGRIGSGSSSRASSHASLHVTGSSTLNGNAAAAQSEHTGATSTESTSRMERRVQRAASGAASRASSSASIPSAFSITAAAVVSTVPPPIRDGSRESIVARTLAAAEAAAAVAAEVDARRPLLAMADMPRPLRESVNGNTDTDMAVDHHDDNDDDDDENDDGIDSEVHVRWRQERLTNGRTFADEDAHLASLASGVLEHFLRRGLVNRAMRHAGEGELERRERSRCSY